MQVWEDVYNRKSAVYFSAHCQRTQHSSHHQHFEWYAAMSLLVFLFGILGFSFLLIWFFWWARKVFFYPLYFRGTSPKSDFFFFAPDDTQGHRCCWSFHHWHLKIKFKQLWLLQPLLLEMYISLHRLQHFRISSEISGVNEKCSHSLQIAKHSWNFKRPTIIGDDGDVVVQPITYEKFYSWVERWVISHSLWFFFPSDFRGFAMFRWFEMCRY